MSAPGFIPPSELEQIGPDAGGDVGRLRIVPAAWFRKTDAELRARFGFGIDFRNTGTYRTRAMTNSIPGALPGGDHEKGRALDIRNWATFAARDPLAFYRILAANGWRNITSDGKPFRTEPWHWVCTKTDKPPLAAPTRRSKGVTLFYCTKTDKPSLEGARQPIHAWGMGGDSPGTSANWQTTTDRATSLAWAAQHGATGNNWVFLTRAQFEEKGRSYLEPLRIAGGTAADDAGVLTAIAQVPAKTVDELKARL